MPKIYKTMRGEKIDIEALFRKHELTQAVGNIPTNARGDILGPGGSVVKTREQKAKEYYQRQKAAKQAAQKAADEAAARDAASAVPEQPAVDKEAAPPKTAIGDVVPNKIKPQKNKNISDHEDDI